MSADSRDKYGVINAKTKRKIHHVDAKEKAVEKKARSLPTTTAKTSYHNRDFELMRGQRIYEGRPRRYSFPIRLPTVLFLWGYWMGVLGCKPECVFSMSNCQ